MVFYVLVNIHVRGRNLGTFEQKLRQEASVISQVKIEASTKQRLWGASGLDESTITDERRWTVKADL